MSTMRTCRTRSACRVSWLAVLLFVAATTAARAEEPFFLKGGERVVFFGDSITQNGQYINYVEAYLLTRFPDAEFRLINHGISSETISGTSEEDHDPRRPWALPRFTRDVAAWKPDIVVACFGMNDGNYHPFEPTRFGKYQEGIRELVDRTQNEAHAKPVLMTPPPFDPYRRKAADPEATSFGYKFPAIDYDHTLAEYSKWLLTLRDEGLVVVDQHAATNEHLRRRREKQVSFYLAGDAVHPNATGHWLMAQNLLLEWNAPATAAELTIDASDQETPRSKNEDVSELVNNEGVISFSWKTLLPMPMDPNWDRESIELEQVVDRLNRYRLAVSGLPSGRYQLFADETLVATCTDEDLSEGLDVLQLPKFPTIERSRNVLELVRERRGLIYRNWREMIAQSSGQVEGSVPEEKAKTVERIRQIGVELDRIRKPVEVSVKLVPADNR